MAALTTLRKDARTKVRRANKKAAPVASDARDNVVKAAGTTYDWAAPKVEATRNWAAPKVEATKEWAAPHAVQTRDWAAPKVEPAVDKLRDDVLPRVAGAVTAALAASEPAREEAKIRGTAALAALKGELDPPPTPRRRRTKRFFLLVTVLGAAYAGWRAWSKQGEHSSLAQPEPWASSTGGGYDGSYGSSVPAATYPTTDDAAGASPDEALADAAGDVPAAEVTDVPTNSGPSTESVTAKQSKKVSDASKAGPSST